MGANRRSAGMEFRVSSDRDLNECIARVEPFAQPSGDVRCASSISFLASLSQYFGEVVSLQCTQRSVLYCAIHPS